MGGGYQSGVLPVDPGREPLTGLAILPGAQRQDRRRRKGEGAAGSFGLGIAVHAHLPPYGHMWRNQRVDGWVPIQVHMLPAQGPGFFGAEPGQQAQDDIAVHELGRAADIFQTAP